MPRRLLRLLPLLLLLAGCRGGEPGGISREQFVRVSVALRLVPDSAADAAERRAAILEREGVTAQELEAWVRRAAREDALLAETWTEIAAQVDSARPRHPVQGPDEEDPRVDLPPPPPVGAPDLDSLLRMRPPKPPRPVPDSAG